MVSAVSLGMIVGLYDEARQRAQAIGAYSFVGAAGASVGLVLGGVLTEALSWHWIFFVNVPIGLAALGLGGWLVPADQGATSSTARRAAGERGPAVRPGLRAGRLGIGWLGIDWLSAGLVTAGLMTGVFALVGTAGSGWGSARTLGFGAAGVVLLAGFAVRQARVARPLLPLRVLAARGVAGANLAQVLVIAAAFGFQVVVTLYLQRVLGYGPAAAGLGLLPTAIVIGIVSLGFSARLASRLGERIVLRAGLALVVIALALLTRLPAHGSYLVHLLAPMVIFGVGGGLTLPALAGLGMSEATPRDAGVVSGLFNTTQQVGAAIGVALLPTLAAAQTARLHAHGAAATAALAGGYRLAMVAGAALAVAALLVAVTVLRAGPQDRCVVAQPGPAGHGAEAEAEAEAESPRAGVPAPAASCHNAGVTIGCGACRPGHPGSPDHAHWSPPPDPAGPGRYRHGIGPDDLRGCRWTILLPRFVKMFHPLTGGAACWPGTAAGSAA